MEPSGASGQSRGRSWMVTAGVVGLLGFAGVATLVGVHANQTSSPQALQLKEHGFAWWKGQTQKEKAEEEKAEEEKEQKEEREMEEQKEKAEEYAAEEYAYGQEYALTYSDTYTDGYGDDGDGAASGETYADEYAAQGETYADEYAAQDDDDSDSAENHDPAKERRADDEQDPLVKEQWLADNWWQPDLPEGVSRWLRSSGITERGVKLNVNQRDSHWKTAIVCDMMGTNWATPIANSRWVCQSNDAPAGSPAEFTQRFHVEDEQIVYNLDYFVEGSATVVLNDAAVDGCKAGSPSAISQCSLSAAEGLVLGENIIKMVVSPTQDGRRPAAALFASVKKPDDTVAEWDDLIPRSGLDANGTVVDLFELDAHWYDLTNGKPFRAAAENTLYGGPPFDFSRWVIPDGWWDKDPVLDGLASTYVVSTDFAVPPENMKAKLRLFLRGGTDVLSVFCDRQLVKPCSVGGSAFRACEFDVDQTCHHEVVDNLHELMIVYHTEPGRCSEDEAHCHSAITISSEIVPKQG